MSPMADSASGGVIRFGVRSSDGLCSSVFRLWANPKASDVYLAAHSVSGDFKVSLQSSGKWRIGFTAAQVGGRSPATRTRPPKASEERIVDRWPRPSEMAPGLTKAFAVLVASAGLTLPPADSESDLADVSWCPTPEAKRLVEFLVFLSTPAVTLGDWPGRGASATTLIGSLLLANRETVWVVAQESDNVEPHRIGRLSPLEGGTRQEALARLFGPGPDDRLRGLIHGTTREGLRCLYEAVSSTRP
jgi:hypothetical protein